MTDYQSANVSLSKFKSSTGKHLERPNRSKQHTNKTQLPVGVIQVTNKLLDMNQKTLICNTKQQQLTTSRMIVWKSHDTAHPPSINARCLACHHFQSVRTLLWILRDSFWGRCIYGETIERGQKLICASCVSCCTEHEVVFSLADGWFVKGKWAIAIAVVAAALGCETANVHLSWPPEHVSMGSKYYLILPT